MDKGNVSCGTLKNHTVYLDNIDDDDNKQDDIYAIILLRQRKL